LVRLPYATQSEVSVKRPDLDVRGQRVTDDAFVLCFNAHCGRSNSRFRQWISARCWEPAICTADTVIIDGAKPADAAQSLTV
jgi:glycogen operon protein